VQIIGGDAATRAEVDARLNRIERAPAATAPIVVVLLAHHGGDGLAAIRAAIQADRSVLILTDGPSVVEAGLVITAGAVGYLPLTAPLDELRRALASVQAGSLHWTPHVAAAVLVGLRSYRLSPLIGDELAAQLRVLLRLVGQCWSIAQAGRALDLDDQTTQHLLLTAQNALWKPPPPPETVP
jgi:DNA-binding NarL/FixJ family response regulator